MFEKIKLWYKQGLWNDAMVQNAVIKKIITEEQANDIMNN